MPNPLAILFKGESHNVTLLNGQTIKVAIRALPERFLGEVIEHGEHKHTLISICGYFEHVHYTVNGKTKFPYEGPSLLSHIPAPDGFTPIPYGITDNFDDASIEALYASAKSLNFSRALEWAKGQISAKKEIAPVKKATMEQVMPLVLSVMDPLLKRLDALSTSTPSAPSSSAAPKNPS